MLVGVDLGVLVGMPVLVVVTVERCRRREPFGDPPQARR